MNGSALAAKAEASAAPLPRVLGNAFVSVEGVRAPLLTTDSGTIEFQVPGDIPAGTASVVDWANGAASATIDMIVQIATPSVLAAVHLDGTTISTANPPVAGETLVLYATGLGAVEGDLPIGAAGPSDPTAATVATPQVALGNTPLTVTYSGLTPGFVGLYQVNAAVPSDLPLRISPLALTLTESGQQGAWSTQ